MIKKIVWNHVQLFSGKQLKLYFEDLKPQLHHLRIKINLPGTSKALANTKQTFSKYWKGMELKGNKKQPNLNVILPIKSRRESEIQIMLKPGSDKKIYKIKDIIFLSITNIQLKWSWNRLNFKT